LKVNRIVVTGALALCAALAAFVPSHVQAQTDADVLQNAFAFSTTINAITNFNYTLIPIPAGKRLVVQNVNMSGAAASTSGPYVVPIVLFSSTLGSGPSVNHYFAPPQNLQDSEQFYEDAQTTMYADTLYVSPAFAGFTPTFMVFNVTVTGYLVSAPPPPPAPPSPPK
jgi:hypothetical protein